MEVTAAATTPPAAVTVDYPAAAGVLPIVVPGVLLAEALELLQEIGAVIPVGWHRRRDDLVRAVRGG